LVIGADGEDVAQIGTGSWPGDDSFRPERRAGYHVGRRRLRRLIASFSCRPPSGEWHIPQGCYRSPPGRRSDKPARLATGPRGNRSPDGQETTTSFEVEERSLSSFNDRTALVCAHGLSEGRTRLLVPDRRFNAVEVLDLAQKQPLIPAAVAALW